MFHPLKSKVSRECQSLIVKSSSSLRPGRTGSVRTSLLARLNPSSAARAWWVDLHGEGHMEAISISACQAKSHSTYTRAPAPQQQHQVVYDLKMLKTKSDNPSSKPLTNSTINTEDSTPTVSIHSKHPKGKILSNVGR